MSYTTEDELMDKFDSENELFEIFKEAEEIKRKD